MNCQFLFQILLLAVQMCVLCCSRTSLLLFITGLGNFPCSDILLCSFLACLHYLLGNMLHVLQCPPPPPPCENPYESYFCGDGPDGVVLGWLFSFLVSSIPISRLEESRVMRNPENSLRMRLLKILLSLPVSPLHPPHHPHPTPGVVKPSRAKIRVPSAFTAYRQPMT